MDIMDSLIFRIHKHLLSVHTGTHAHAHTHRLHLLGINHKTVKKLLTVFSQHGFETKYLSHRWKSQKYLIYSESSRPTSLRIERTIFQKNCQALVMAIVHFPSGSKYFYLKCQRLSSNDVYPVAQIRQDVQL